jgi:hypothetical protein
VKHISALLEAQGLKTWIDDTDNRENMLFSIADGIRKSRFFIAFLTSNFNAKIAQGHEKKEWCFRELNYATYILSPRNIILVVLEEEMMKKKDWATVLQFQFANDVYYDFSKVERHIDGVSKIDAWSKLIENLLVGRVKPLIVESEKVGLESEI